MNLVQSGMVALVPETVWQLADAMLWFCAGYGVSSLVQAEWTAQTLSRVFKRGRHG